MKKFLIFLPVTVGDADDEWMQCLKQIKNFTLDGYQLIKMNVFTDLPDYESFIDICHKINKTVFNVFGDKCPSFDVTAHPPQRPWKIAIESCYQNNDYSEISYKCMKSIPYVVRESDIGKELWAGGMGTGMFPDDTRAAAEEAFNQMRLILEAENMSFDHIVRQWNFIGNILEIKNGIQNYQLFNRVRSSNYQHYRYIKSFPAATGIGMKHGGVHVDFYAVKSESTTKIIAVNNPDQIKPYAYGQKVLVGAPGDDGKTKQVPQFERAVLLNNKSFSELFVSGTASIKGQDTIGISSVEKQTMVTIENVNTLCDLKRIGGMIGSNGINTGRFVFARVYVKNQDDFHSVKSICNNHFKQVPVIYIQSDICRDNLLVEMEAEFMVNS
ncbi:MAG TPA: hypothetical protein PLR88_09560 [Bacteroidales bacterium]|nr:hypothetical protein [Bacteroidales bacterium]HPT22179.1 hypothetical protein [Bacteroidales bacterium]